MSKLVDEQLCPIADRLRFRRVPENLIDLDPRELYAHDLFMLPLDRRNKAPILRLGEEIEVQWRSRQSEGYAWWRGIVGGIGLIDFTDGALLVPDWELGQAHEIAEKARQGSSWCIWDPAGRPLSEQVDSAFMESDGSDVSRHPAGRVSVLFPHYPASSRWHSVFSSTLGIPEQNPPLSGHLGWVGGIRKVSCTTHHELWKRNFQRVPWFDSS
ncbi:hypothetical protein HDU97_006247 [Phlyctochytrium planicorne]|nr:hypothetical protein HDU97_006247 [Phlyctochytrium planicorne]